MLRHCRFACVLLFAFGVCTAMGADWRQFRGPGGQGFSDEKGLPTEWSASKNIVWKIKLPGAGASSPVTLGKRIFLTCYSGYGMDTKEPGKMEDLRRHLLCIDRTDGKILWSKDFPSTISEHKYAGEGSYHGYAANTPITDGEHLYVFFGKAGVFCFDLDGKQIWHVILGKGQSGWGSGASPMLYKNLLIVNASIEANTIIALDKATGKEVWKANRQEKVKDKDVTKTANFSSSWGIPVLVTAPDKSQELVVNASGRVAGLDPDTGKELWSAKGHGGYVVPSVVTHNGIVYAVGGGGTSLAIKAGGRGDVSETHVLWRMKKGSNASSPVYHDGNLYWVSDGAGVLHVQDAATGKTTENRVMADRMWASPILADGKLYIVSQYKGTFVVAASPKFELIANNTFADDKSRSNASLAASDGQLFLRNDEYLYCIGKK